MIPQFPVGLGVMHVSLYKPHPQDAHTTRLFPWHKVYGFLKGGPPTKLVISNHWTDGLDCWINICISSDL